MALASEFTPKKLLFKEAVLLFFYTIFAAPKIKPFGNILHV